MYANDEKQVLIDPCSLDYQRYIYRQQASSSARSSAR
jgi:hypothetical protein